MHHVLVRGLCAWRTRNSDADGTISIFSLDHPKLHRVVDKTTDECIDYFLRFKLSFGKKVLNVKLDWKAEAAETTATN